VSTLAELASSAADCRACGLAATRTKVVFSSGPEDASLVLLGEAPGAEEDLRGVPFVGRSGQLLSDLLAEVGLERHELYVTNVVKCRPPKNRTPSRTEVVACQRWLEPQLRRLAPRAVVALGAVAARAALGRPVGVSKVRGQLLEGPFGPVVPTFHPAYALRGGARVAEQLRADLATAAEVVGRA
jgi:uracil-DNA glycosylase